MAKEHINSFIINNISEISKYVYEKDIHKISVIYSGFLKDIDNVPVFSRIFSEKSFDYLDFEDNSYCGILLVEMKNSQKHLYIINIDSTISNRIKLFIDNVTILENELKEKHLIYEKGTGVIYNEIFKK